MRRIFNELLAFFALTDNSYPLQSKPYGITWEQNSSRKLFNVCIPLYGRF